MFWTQRRHSFCRRNLFRFSTFPTHIYISPSVWLLYPPACLGLLPILQYPLLSRSSVSCRSNFHPLSMPIFRRSLRCPTWIVNIRANVPGKKTTGSCILCSPIRTKKRNSIRIQLFLCYFCSLKTRRKLADEKRSSREVPETFVWSIDCVKIRLK